MADRYVETPRHRTTMNLPVALLREAEEAVGSTSATETVVIALRELVARRHRQQLLALDLPDLTPESVAAIRRLRFPVTDA